MNEKPIDRYGLLTNDQWDYVLAALNYDIADDGGMRFVAPSYPHGEITVGIELETDGMNWTGHVDLVPLSSAIIRDNAGNADELLRAADSLALTAQRLREAAKRA